MSAASPLASSAAARSASRPGRFSDGSANPKILNGVNMGEGDGTVSLLSLGAMCAEGWQRKRYNPAGIRVVTIEVRSSARPGRLLTPPQLPHNPTPTMPRGGANTSDHVDILGAARLNEIIVKVATGAGDEIEESFVSNIREYARKIKWD
jgi:phospholipid:diacylglycerol acyltransferase